MFYIISVKSAKYSTNVVFYTICVLFYTTSLSVFGLRLGLERSSYNCPCFLQTLADVASDKAF